MVNTERSLHEVLTEIDNIEDDEEFMQAEFEAVRDYCIQKEWKLTDEEWSIIRSRGIEDAINDSKLNWKRYHPTTSRSNLSLIYLGGALNNFCQEEMENPQLAPVSITVYENGKIIANGSASEIKVFLKDKFSRKIIKWDAYFNDVRLSI